MPIELSYGDVVQKFQPIGIFPPSIVTSVKDTGRLSYCYLGDVISTERNTDHIRAEIVVMSGGWWGGWVEGGSCIRGKLTPCIRHRKVVVKFGSISIKRNSDTSPGGGGMPIPGSDMGNGAEMSDTDWPRRSA
ncbi:hypothetical protein J6590_051436 [Homalodisca vitripennis]|nr:hypothetical protein J6590_051436 [Homalodisca vitripennis]